jgi:energy-coupling factor transporter ATP-binding protein EcfA2
LFGPTVRDVVRQVARGWGADEPAIVARLERLGLAATLERSPASLTVSELRGIELGLALARPAPSLVVLYEPWSLVEGVAPDALREALVATAREACVIVVVSALADVASLADEVWLLDGGRWAARDGGPGWVARSSSTLRVLVHDPAGEVAPSLVDAFSRCLPRAHAVGWSAVAEASDLRRITVTTDDLVEAARRIAQVLAERDVDVRSIETPPRTRAEWLERTSMDRTPRAT